MTEFSPCWEIADEDPEECVYTYSDNGKEFWVVVDQDGIIQVHKDDWLSKYSLAIHGDEDVAEPIPGLPASTVPRYLRARMLGPLTLVGVENNDLIREGEHLVHLPTYTKFVQWLYAHPDPPGDVPDPHLESFVPKLEPNWVIEALSGLEALGKTLGPLAVFLVALAPWAAVFAVIAYFAFIMKGIAELGEGHHYRQRFEAAIAATYAATAWVFDDLYDSPQTVGPNADGRPKLRFPVNPDLISEELWDGTHYDMSFEKIAKEKDWVPDEIEAFKVRWEEYSELMINRLDEWAKELLDTYESTHGNRPTLDQLRKTMHKRPKKDGTGHEVMTRSSYFELFKDIVTRDLFPQGKFLFWTYGDVKPRGLGARLRLSELLVKYPPIPISEY